MIFAKGRRTVKIKVSSAKVKDPFLYIGAISDMAITTGLPLFILVTSLTADRPDLLTGTLVAHSERE